MSLYLFAGFQFSSAFFSRIDLEHAIVEGIGSAEQELKSRHGGLLPQIVYQVYDLGSGSRVTEEICRRVAKADVCLFELSDKNPNVMFELGFAYAKRKPSIYLVHRSVPISTMPSDIQGTMYHKYNESNMKVIVAKEIKEKLVVAVNNRLAVSSLLDLTGRVNVICPELPAQHRISYAERKSKDYLRHARFADSDTLFYVVNRLKTLVPSCNISDFLDTEIGDDVFKENVICIGGPGWNSVTASLLFSHNIPLRYGNFSSPINDFVITNSSNGEQYKTMLDPAGGVLSDIGVVVRLRHESEERRLILLHGIQTYGVLGMAKSLLEERFRQTNKQSVDAWCAEDEVSEYIIIAPIPVYNDSPAPTRFIREHFFPIRRRP